MKRATPSLATFKCRRMVLLAILLAVAVTAFNLGSAQQVRAEPPDPCHHKCEF
ncbi:MAG TPA: hypothetical protein VGN55_11235 [Xanthobacteraceae bacterium]